MICEQIKSLVEEYGNVRDIGVKSRKRHLVDLRYVYYKLCVMLGENITLNDIGRGVNRDHCTVIRGLDRFDQHREDMIVDFLPYVKIYTKITKLLKSELLADNDFKDVKSLVQFYRIKHIRLVKKSHEVIKKLQNRINELNKQTHENTIRTNPGTSVNTR